MELGGWVIDIEQSVSGKNQKDMASYKFWQTQPVPRFGQSVDTCTGVMS